MRSKARQHLNNRLSALMDLLLSITPATKMGMPLDFHLIPYKSQVSQNKREVSALAHQAYSVLPVITN